MTRVDKQWWTAAVVIGIVFSIFGTDLRTFLFSVIPNGYKAARIAQLRKRIKSYNYSSKILENSMILMFIFGCSMLLLVWGACLFVTFLTHDNTLLTGAAGCTLMSGVVLTFTGARTIASTKVVERARRKLRNLGYNGPELEEESSPRYTTPL